MLDEYMLVLAFSSIDYPRKDWHTQILHGSDQVMEKSKAGQVCASLDSGDCQESGG